MRSRSAVVGVLVLLGGLAGLGIPERPAHAATLPELTVADVSSTEGDAGTALIRVSVDLSAPSPTAVKVPYSLQRVNDGTADAADASLKSGVMTFAAGVTTKFVTVTTVGDMIVEPDQHFVVTLGVPTPNAVVTDGLGYVTIVDDDADGVNTGIEVSVGDIVMTESDVGVHKAYLPITLSRPATTAVKVKFALSCSTAALLSDVTISFNGSVSFPIGKRTAYIQFQVLPNTTPEQLTAFQEVVQSAAANVFDDSGSVTIVDDDGSLPSSTGVAVPGFATEPIPSYSSFDVGTPGDLEAIEVGYDGGPAQYPPFDPTDSGNETFGASKASVSADGRYVVFASDAVNLVPGDTNGVADVFVRDRLLGTTQRVTHNDGTEIAASELGGLSAWGVAFLGLSISADGGTVVFRTAASLVPEDAPFGGSWVTQLSDYSYDRITHTVALESRDTNGRSIVGAATPPTVSGEGRYVAFGIMPDNTTNSTYPVGGPMHGYWVRDRLTGISTRILADDNLNQVMQVAISANGRFLAAGTTRGNCDDSELDVVDLQTGNTERADVTSAGEGGLGLQRLDGYLPHLSADGRYVSFTSWSWNLAHGNTPPPTSASGFSPLSYLRDRQSLTTTNLFHNRSAQLPVVTANGQHVLVSGLGLWDQFADTVAPVGQATGSDTWQGAMQPVSGDGRYVAFIRSVAVRPGRMINSLYVQRVR